MADPLLKGHLDAKEMQRPYRSLWDLLPFSTILLRSTGFKYSTSRRHAKLPRCITHVGLRLMEVSDSTGWTNTYVG